MDIYTVYITVCTCAHIHTHTHNPTFIQQLEYPYHLSSHRHNPIYSSEEDNWIFNANMIVFLTFKYF